MVRRFAHALKFWALDLFWIICKRIIPKYRYKREKIQYEHGDGQKRGDGDEKYRVHVH